MGLRLFVVDAFTDRAFAGNPAAVCLLSEPRDERWMQNVASEMNLSETAFLLRKDKGFDLRWFTPEVEVDLCGHATLASAHVLWEMSVIDAGEGARFGTRSGTLLARRQGEWIELDFPAEEQAPASSFPEMEQALGVTPEYLGKNRFDYLVQVSSEYTVRHLDPDFSLLRMLPCRGVMVTSLATSPGIDFVSRFFAPAVGVPEDPVTGSAHCCLGPFWAKHLGKTDLVGYQASSRGGTVRVRVTGDRVLLKGQAVTVVRGELLA
ncbi:PhzF family phenazine biosynthesis protein [Thermodesulfobacteriota bacterium]